MRDTGGSRGGEWAAGRPFGFALVSEPAVSDPRSPISDSQIQTDSDLQTQFVQQNLRRIFLLIYRVVGNVDDAQDLIGTIGDVRIEKALANSLSGVLISAPVRQRALAH